MNAALGLVPHQVAAMDQPLVEPEVRRSAGGVLQTSIIMRYAYRDVGGFRLFVRTYEGGSPGPTLRLKPGDTLKLRLANEFPPNRDAMPSNISIPHQFNNTNFHFHGSHVSPSGIADNVMRSMVPGESYDIEINLPKDHTRGTYWYHPQSQELARVVHAQYGRRTGLPDRGLFYSDFAVNRMTQMPAILISADLHRRGKLHVERESRWSGPEGDPDSNESQGRFTQGFAIDVSARKQAERLRADAEKR